MGKIKDLTGQKFGKLTVLEITNERRNRQVVWKCQCECGNITYVVGQALRSGHTKSCGCNFYKQKAKNLTGERFGKLTVLKRSDKISNDRHVFWDCQCECGNLRIVDGTALRNGDITACHDCSKKNIIFTKGAVGPLKNHVGERFGFLTVIELVNNRTPSGKAIWKCQCDCGNICYVDSNSLVSKNTISCGCQKKSIGEEQIANILRNNNINFLRQYSFNDCLSPKNSKLLFDFAIFNDNNILLYLIEYDGIQHFQPIEYFGGYVEYEYRKECDEIKNQYCQNNNIPLIRIPYTLKNNIQLKDLQL